MNKHESKRQFNISPERLAELRRKVLIKSTGSSLRLSGSKVTDKQVEQIMILSKFSEQKKEHQTK